MRKIVIAVVVLGLLLTAGDVLAKKTAEKQIADRARSGAGANASAESHISSFPFVGRIVVSGSVPEVDLRVDKAVVGDLTLTWVDVDLRGVRLDRHQLFSDQKAEIKRISSGRLTIALDSAALSALAHQPVTVGDGQISLRVGGRAVQATPAVDGHGQLTLKVDPLPALPLRLPRSDLVPCAATTVQVDGDTVELTCPFRDVPPALLKAAQTAG